MERLIATGKFKYQAFPSETKDDLPAGGISKKNCVKYMQDHCTAEMQARPLLMSAGSPGRGTGPCFGPSICPQTVTAFLIVRPAVGFLGYGWESDDKEWHDIFLLQPGEPQGHCKEENGV